MWSVHLYLEYVSKPEIQKIACDLLWYGYHYKIEGDKPVIIATATSYDSEYEYWNQFESNWTHCINNKHASYKMGLYDNTAFIEICQQDR